MDVEEAVVLEEEVGGVGQVVLDAGDRAHDLRAGSQVGDVPEGLEADVLAGKGVLVVIAPPVHHGLLVGLAL